MEFFSEYTFSRIDRESERSRASNGAFILGIRASEVGEDKGTPDLRRFVDTEVTILIEVSLLQVCFKVYLHRYVVWMCFFLKP